MFFVNDGWIFGEGSPKVSDHQEVIIATPNLTGGA
jgi:hypothetical protein